MRKIYLVLFLVIFLFPLSSMALPVDFHLSWDSQNDPAITYCTYQNPQEGIWDKEHCGLTVTADVITLDVVAPGTFMFGVTALNTYGESPMATGSRSITQTEYDDLYLQWLQTKVPLIPKLAPIDVSVNTSM